jgi:hypothetical protein
MELRNDLDSTAEPQVREESRLLSPLIPPERERWPLGLLTVPSLSLGQQEPANSEQAMQAAAAAPSAVRPSFMPHIDTQSIISTQQWGGPAVTMASAHGPFPIH